MLTPIEKTFRGLITVTGPTKSGKSQLAEFLIKEQEFITYIATSKPRKNDPEWQKRINIHRKRRPENWNLIEHPKNICKLIESFDEKESILLDSLGGLVEQHLMENDDSWETFQGKFIECISNNQFGKLIIVIEEIGWGVVPATSIGNLFRERHTNLASLVFQHSSNKWLAINGTAIDLDKTGSQIP